MLENFSHAAASALINNSLSWSGGELEGALQLADLKLSLLPEPLLVLAAKLVGEGLVSWQTGFIISEV